MSDRCSATTSTLYLPMSFSEKNSCQFRLDNLILSGSHNVSSLTPICARPFVIQLPIPPTPNILILEFLTFSCSLMVSS